MDDQLLFELLPGSADMRIREIDKRRSQPAQRIQRAHRALHDARQMTPADARYLPRWRPMQPSIAGQKCEIDLATDDLDRRPDRACDTLEQRGLAGAGLARDPVNFGAPHRKADTIDGLDLAS